MAKPNTPQIKKPVMVDSKTNQEGNNKLKKGEVNRMLQEEKPIENEVQVNLLIKAVKYGNKECEAPETTTIFNGRKVTQKIPFSKKLEYKFKKVEDGMVFKFAITSAGDLLGFLYLEIPQKFKSMKEFQLDDWFPIKQVQTDEEHIIKSENFVARVIISYKASRKLIITEMFNTKLGTIQMQQELVSSLKQKLDNIHNQVDAFGDEGFKHLVQFEKKMMKKRINMKGFKETEKADTKFYNTEKPLTKEKKDLYKTKGVVAENNEVKKGEIKNADLFNFKANDYKKGGENGGDEYNKILKELSHARKELIETTQKLEALEEGQLSVDNIQFRKKLQDLQKDIMKDRTELTIRLREQSNIAEAEKLRMKKEFEEEKNNLARLKKESENLVLEYNSKLEYLRETEREMDNKNKKLEEENKIAKSKEEKLIKREKDLKREIENYEEMAEELEDTKERLMMERRKIFEESENFQGEKGDIDLRVMQLENKEEFLNKERFNLEKEKLRFSKEMIKEQEALKGQKELFELEKKSLDDTKNDFDNKMNDLLKDKAKTKMEKMSLWREKTDHQKEVKEFMEYKQVIEAEQKAHQEELDNDYEFIDEQLNLVDINKKELDQLKENLENYESFLENQQRLINEKQKKFDISQRKFFEKLTTSGFNIDEMKKYGEQMGLDMDKLQKELEKEQKFEKKLLEQKDKFKKNIDTLSMEVPENNIPQRRTTINARRTSKIANLQRMSKQTQSKNQMELNYHIKKGVDDLIENIFANVNVTNMGIQTKKKDETILTLENEIEKLKEALKTERETNKKMKLKHFVVSKMQTSGALKALADSKDKDNMETQKKSVTIMNPAPESVTALNVPPSMMRESMASMKTLNEPKTMKELKQDVIDLCDISMQHMKDNLQHAKKVDKVEERIAFLDRSKKALSNIFKILNLIHNSKKDFDNGIIKTMDLFNEDFDFELLKDRYETKIKTLVDYIKKIRENNDFFNFSVDNNVLTA